MSAMCSWRDICIYVLQPQEIPYPLIGAWNDVRAKRQGRDENDENDGVAACLICSPQELSQIKAKTSRITAEPDRCTGKLRSLEFVGLINMIERAGENSTGSPGT